MYQYTIISWHVNQPRKIAVTELVRCLILEPRGLNTQRYTIPPCRDGCYTFLLLGFYHEKETTIMQLDSAAMAKYGIQLKNAERAWLVKSWELERQIEALQRLTAERDTVHDSIPVPYPVEKRLTKWQQAKVDWGGWALLILIVLVVIAIYYPRRNTGSK